MSRGQFLTELRRSNAAGTHDHKPTRSRLNREAINMSMFDGEYGLPAVDDDTEIGFDNMEPTDEDLLKIELENTSDEDRYVGYGDYDEYDLSDPYDSEYDR